MAKYEYKVPTPDKIAEAQNDDANLRLLLAQRVLYSRAKIWTFVRGAGVGIVAVAAPILTALWPQAAVPAATVAACWYVLNHLLFKTLERRGATRGATVQEQFDTSIFGMPTIAVRDPRILPEDLSRLTGGRKRRRRAYASEGLKDWYPIRRGVSGAVAIAIAQRANVAYTRRLLDWNARIWLGLLVTWSIATVAISLANGFDLATFLLVAAIPVLPPLVDSWGEYRRVHAAGREREALANEIQDAIMTSKSSPIAPEQLIAWQSQLFALRRDTPLVSDWLYAILRNRNETEMSDAAETISKALGSERESL